MKLCVSSNMCLLKMAFCEQKTNGRKHTLALVITVTKPCFRNKLSILYYIYYPLLGRGLLLLRSLKIHRNYQNFKEVTSWFVYQEREPIIFNLVVTWTSGGLFGWLPCWLQVTNATEKVKFLSWHSYNISVNTYDLQGIYFWVFQQRRSCMD